MAFNQEHDMDRENGVYFPEAHPVIIGKWYLLEQSPVMLDGITISDSKIEINWKKHLGHFVQVIGYSLPMQTDHFGNADIYCKQCKKSLESISTQLLKEINE